MQLLALIVELVSLDRDWVPRSTDSSLYIRPALIATDATLELSSPKRAKLFVIAGPVGSYFPTGGFQPVSVLADPSVARAFPGGVGGFKMGWLVPTSMTAFAHPKLQQLCADHLHRQNGLRAVWMPGSALAVGRRPKVDGSWRHEHFCLLAQCNRWL